MLQIIMMSLLVLSMQAVSAEQELAVQDMDALLQEETLAVEAMSVPQIAMYEVDALLLIYTSTDCQVPLRMMKSAMQSLVGNMEAFDATYLPELQQRRQSSGGKALDQADPFYANYHSFVVVDIHTDVSLLLDGFAAFKRFAASPDSAWCQSMQAATDSGHYIRVVTLFKEVMQDALRPYAALPSKHEFMKSS